MMKNAMRFMAFLWIMLLCQVSFSLSVAWAASADSEIYPGSENPGVATLVNHQSVLKSNASEAGGTQVFLAIPTDAERSIPVNPSKGIDPLRIGFGRPVDVLKTSQAARNQLHWIPADNGGVVATLSLISPGAVGMRLGIQVENLPDQAELRFFAPGNMAEIISVSGELVNRLIALNLKDLTADPQQARMYWSPVIQGENIAVELYLPPGLSPKDVSIAIPQVSHLYRSPIAMGMPNKAIGDSDSCEVDVMCASSAWQEQGKAVAHMVFSEGGGSYICTGTLLNDVDSSTFIPYFLSANHCISTQLVASTLETYWFYRASSCNSGSLSSSSQRLSGGAALLYAAPDTDTSFMRLNSNPPTGVLFSGWDSATLPVGTSITGLHNPSGDLQKISTGTVTGYATCGSGASYSCSVASSTNGDHLVITWSQGVTEGGSSGSGLFSSSSFKLIGGQLHGGSSYCSDPTAADQYGRFDLAYQRSLSQWLNAAPSNTYTLSVSKAGTGSGTVTSSPSGINCGSTCSANFSGSVTLTAEATTGSTFAGWSGDCSGTATSCPISMTAARNVTAIFNINTGGSTDIVVLNSSSPNVIGAGSGDDIYILNPSLLTSARTYTLSDTQGNNNVIQLVSGLQIASSALTSNALRLTLTNGARVDVYGANGFRYAVCGNAAAGLNPTPVTFATFATATLGVAVPANASTIVNGKAVTINCP